jgi:hypothetical protein
VGRERRAARAPLRARPGGQQAPGRPSPREVGAIADEVRAIVQPAPPGQRPSIGKWQTGQTPVSRLLGKELVLLAWAIEDADPALIPQAIRNWHGLAPEERWWLFTMTNAATGHALGGSGKGWRKAVRFALTENPVYSARPPDMSRSQPTFGLFRELPPDSAAWSSPSVRHAKLTDHRLTYVDSYPHGGFVHRITVPRFEGLEGEL